MLEARLQNGFTRFFTFSINGIFNGSKNSKAIGVHVRLFFPFAYLYALLQVNDAVREETYAFLRPVRDGYGLFTGKNKKFNFK